MVSGNDFVQVLQAWHEAAQSRERDHIDIRAADLHREVGEYPGNHHVMPTCCAVMLKAMVGGDEVIVQPPSGKGASLTIRYRLPRPAMNGPLPVFRPPQAPVALAKPVPKVGHAVESTVYLVSCVASKRATPTRAADLYVSPWFLAVRRLVEKSGMPWFMLSSEYGLLAPDEVIAPYDRTLKTAGAAERQDWARRVRQQMDERLPSCERIVIFAGRTYRENLMDYLRGRAAAVEVPLEGLRIGEQLAWLARAAAP